MKEPIRNAAVRGGHSHADPQICGTPPSLSKINPVGHVNFSMGSAASNPIGMPSLAAGVRIQILRSAELRRAHIKSNLLTPYPSQGGLLEK